MRAAKIWRPSAPVAPANLEIPRDVMAGWEREASEKDVPILQKCGWDSWKAYVEFNNGGTLEWSSRAQLYRSRAELCCIQPWGPCGLCACCCCWDNTYLAYWCTSPRNASLGRPPGGAAACIDSAG
jgi:hypothetical protein